MQYTIDATNQKLGRLASEVAVLLQGKNDPSYEPRLGSGVRVVIKNATKLDLREKKWNKKIYYRHTGYMGHLFETKFREAFAKSPEKVVRKAIYNMLPKNRLRAKRLNNLVIER